FRQPQPRGRCQSQFARPGQSAVLVGFGDAYERVFDGRAAVSKDRKAVAGHELLSFEVPYPARAVRPERVPIEDAESTLPLELGCQFPPFRARLATQPGRTTNTPSGRIRGDCRV